MSVAEVPVTTTEVLPTQQESELQLAVAAAEYALFLHTPGQKQAFQGALENYATVITDSVGQTIEAHTASRATETQTIHGAVQTLVDSKKTVLSADIDHRLTTRRSERLKERISDGKITRSISKLAAIAVYGSGSYLVAHAIVSGGHSAEQNTLLVGSAAATQIGMRALSQEITNFTHKLLDEYVPHDESKEANSDELRQHTTHVTAAEASLYRTACTHLNENPGDYQGMAPKLVDNLTNWYTDYYTQPTWKDRLKVLAIGSATLASAGMTVMHL